MIVLLVITCVVITCVVILPYFFWLYIKLTQPLTDRDSLFYKKWENFKRWLSSKATLYCMAVVFAVLTYLSFTFSGDDKTNLSFILIIVQIVLTAFFLFRAFYAKNYRILPNIALTAGWIMAMVASYLIFFPESNAILAKFRQNNLLPSLEWLNQHHLLEIFSGGALGTSVLAVISGATKGMWDQPNSQLIQRFKKYRHQYLIGRSCILGINTLVWRITLLSFAIGFLFIAVFGIEGRQFQRGLVWMFFFTVDLGFLGIAPQFFVSDSGLIRIQTHYIRHYTKKLHKNLYLCQNAQAKEVGELSQIIADLYSSCLRNDIPSLKELLDSLETTSFCLDRLTFQIIFRFRENMHLYIMSADQKELSEAEKHHIELAFSSQIASFLEEKYAQKPTSNININVLTIVETLRLGIKCLFDDQSTEWSWLLCGSGITYEELRNLVFLDLLHFVWQQYNDDASEKCGLYSVCYDTQNPIEKAELLLEIPYIVEKKVKERFGNQLSCFEETTTERMPFCTRVEVYYWNLFQAKIQIIGNSNRIIQEIANTVSAFRLNAYAEDDKFMHHMLPIQNCFYHQTPDVGTYSILIDSPILNVVPANYAEIIPGWNKMSITDLPRCYSKLSPNPSRRKNFCLNIDEVYECLTRIIFL